MLDLSIRVSWIYCAYTSEVKWYVRVRFSSQIRNTDTQLMSMVTLPNENFSNPVVGDILTMYVQLLYCAVVKKLLQRYAGHYSWMGKSLSHSYAKYEYYNLDRTVYGNEGVSSYLVLQAPAEGDIPNTVRFPDVDCTKKNFEVQTIIKLKFSKNHNFRINLHNRLRCS